MDGFVGRLAELRQLDSALDRAGQGSGRLITVTGPAGVGKTRYCEQGADRARAAGFTVVWGRCWTDGGAPALWPWQSILAELCGPDATTLLDGAAGLDTVDMQRLSRFVAVVDRLAQACAGAPTLLVIDDIHAADPGALLLTRFVARSLHRLPLVMVITQRPGAAPPEAAAMLAGLDNEGDPIVLGCFDLAETTAFLATHDVDHHDPGVIEAVHAVSEGNPLYLRRLVALEATHPVAGLPNVIDQSLRLLSPTTVRLLTTGAILGMSVSVTEVAQLIGVRNADVLAALEETAGSGLANPAGPDSFTYSHDLVRQALAAHLSPAERLDAHARAAEIIRATGSVERLGRLAHHALNAAPRSPEDARAAVEACRAAAASMVRHFAYEQAAALLAAATGLHTGGQLGPAPARLLLDWAQAVLSCGRLAEAGQLFEQAAAAAREERNPTVFAEAALGLGGMWVNKYRGRVDRARVLARLHEAMARLPASNTVLRCRLTTRHAAELAYQGRTTGGVLAALEFARKVGDRRALAEALCLAHHALLSPEHGRRRLAMANELIALASAAGLEILTLVGVCRRTIDLFHLGDPQAERSMTDLRRQAELLSCRSVLFIHNAMEVMQLIRAGRLAEAEQRAEECYRLGTEVGDPDAPVYHGAHQFSIHWLQGRGGELVELAEQIANSPNLPDTDFTFQANLALLAAEAGQHDRARSALHRMDLAAIPLASTWLVCMFSVVEAAAILDEPAIARQAYELLTPFAHLPIIPSMGIVCLGSTELPLGLAALTFGDVEAAVAHLERAVEANVRLANRPLTALARADLAVALRRRGAAGDHERAAKLLETAIADATEMGMTRRAESWAARRPRPLTIRRSGNRWLIIHEERETLVGDLVGMRYLARLVDHPGVEISALDLVSDGQLAEPSNHPVIDASARAAYTRRARELAEDLAEARRGSDLARITRLELELDALTAEIERDTGLNGRARNFSGPAERARTAVRKAITRAIDTIATTDPAAATTLRATVTTGYHCVYQPR